VEKFMKMIEPLFLLKSKASVKEIILNSSEPICRYI